MRTSKHFPPDNHSDRRMCLHSRHVSICLFAGVLLCVLLGCSEVKADETTLSKIEELNLPLKLVEVAARLGKFNHGHGPYVWYKSQDALDKEYWFWFSIKSKNVSIEDIVIVFITLVNRDNPDDSIVVWPEKFKSMPQQEVFDLFYK
jgi:hypothetical protein